MVLYRHLNIEINQLTTTFNVMYDSSEPADNLTKNIFIAP